jgi:hypothetical protein
MEILLGIGIFFLILILGLVVWRLRVHQELEERRVWAAYTVPGRDSYPGEPWPWPKGRDK